MRPVHSTNKAPLAAQPAAKSSQSVNQVPLSNNRRRNFKDLLAKYGRADGNHQCAKFLSLNGCETASDGTSCKARSWLQHAPLPVIDRELAEALTQHNGGVALNVRVE